MPRICLLDPSITSRDGAATGNLGDLIIRQAVECELMAGGATGDADWVSIPTQLPLTVDEIETAVESDLLVIGGTNLLSSHMQQYRQWQIGPEEAMRLSQRGADGGWVVAISGCARCVHAIGMLRRAVAAVVAIGS